MWVGCAIGRAVRLGARFYRVLGQSAASAGEPDLRGGAAGLDGSLSPACLPPSPYTIRRRASRWTPPPHMGNGHTSPLSLPRGHAYAYTCMRVHLPRMRTSSPEGTYIDGAPSPLRLDDGAAWCASKPRQPARRWTSVHPNALTAFLSEALGGVPPSALATRLVGEEACRN